LGATIGFCIIIDASEVIKDVQGKVLFPIAFGILNILASIVAFVGKN